jgi:spermidine synthase
MSREQRAVLAAIFAFSGATALIYEIVWTRLLGLLVGHTTYGLTTVLAAFMAGLGMGGWWGGRLAGRVRSPLRAYALLEAGIAIAGVGIGPLLLALEPAFGAVYRALPGSTLALTGVRFLLCGAGLLVPTVMMGMTLPLLVAAAGRRERIGTDVGLLYGVNTVGAAGGSLLAGLVLLPAFGIRGTTLVAATLNLLVAMAAYMLSRTSDAAAMAGAASAEPSPSVSRSVADAPTVSVTGRDATGAPEPVMHSWVAVAALAASALSAAAAMTQQVSWVRAVGLAIGSTTDAFTLIVSAFILGLALGAAAFGRLADRSRDPVALLAVPLCGAGLSALAVLPLLGTLPLHVAEVIRDTAGDHARVLLWCAVRVFLLFLVPTFFMGGAFPIVARILARAGTGVGRTVGEAYAASTIGSIAGAVLGGFVLVPILGARGASIAAAAVSIAAGWVLLSLRPLDAVRGAGLLRAAEVGAASVATGVLVAFLPPWDPALVNSGPYVNTGGLLRDASRDGRTLEETMRSLPVIWWREGVDATVAVLEWSDGRRTIALNGKPDASSEGDRVTQSLLAHLPLALHPAPRSVLVIGLGSGMTAGAAARYAVERIDVAEISEAVVEAAARFFGAANGGVLSDARVRILPGDARTTVGQGRGVYDVIISEPSNLYMAGVPELFTVEFFRMLRDRLAPGGLVCQWIHAYNLGADDFKMVLRTFAEVFPAVSLWDAQLGSDFLLIGAPEGGGNLRVSHDRLASVFADRGIAADLALLETREPADLLGWFVASADGVRAFAGPGPLNTVDRNRLEFSVPRSMRLGPAVTVFTEIDGLRRREAFDWVEHLPSPDIAERANSRRRDTKNYVAVQISAFLGDRDGALRSYGDIERREGPVAWRRARGALIELGWRTLLEGDAPGAAALGEALVRGDPADDGSLRLLAVASHRAGDEPAARKALGALIDATRDPDARAWAEESLRLLGAADPAR